MLLIVDCVLLLFVVWCCVRFVVLFSRVDCCWFTFVVVCCSTCLVVLFWFACLSLCVGLFCLLCGMLYFVLVLASCWLCAVCCSIRIVG